MSDAPHFAVTQSGDSLEGVSRDIANDAIRSGHPDHYVALFARAIQIIAMHKLPATCGTTDSDDHYAVREDKP